MIKDILKKIDLHRRRAQAALDEIMMIVDEIIIYVDKRPMLD